MPLFDRNRPLAPDPFADLPAVPSFTLTSPDVEDGGPLRRAQTGLGRATPPRLTWSGFPSATRSFLLTCFDADAPRAGGLYHWAAVDIPPDVTSTHGVAPLWRTLLPGPAGRHPLGPSATYLRNSLGLRCFIGASPPPGDRPHRYYFAVHALDAPRMDLPDGANTRPEVVVAAAVPHTLARAVLVGRYRVPPVETGVSG